jgi:large subunit ribosomal protein L20
MRVKRGIKARQRRNKLLKLAKGFRGRSKNTTRQMRQRLDKSLCYTYRDRRQRKRQMRGIWIVRLSAAAKLNGISYSKLVNALKTAKIDLDRKILADLGALHPEVFTKVKEVAVGVK